MAAKITQAALASLYILTFNCGRSLIEVDAFASQLFDGLESPIVPDILVLSLQEIAPIPHSFIGGSFLVPYFQRFHDAVQRGASKLPHSDDDSPIYTPIAIRNMGMTAIMVFVRDPSAVQDVEVARVGVGMAEMGNKGAVAVRFTYGDGAASTEMTFVAVHLAAMEEEILRRNEDWKNIVRRLVFMSGIKASGTAAASAEERPLLSVSSQDASIFKATSHLFVAGDLNYRTSTMSPSPSDHIDTFPQPHHDASSPNHFSSLLERDQLRKEQAAGRTLHGLIEAPITFPPTYKYDPKEPFLTPDEDLSKWHWAKHRWPSWCDRILYLDMPSWVRREKPNAKIIAKNYTALPLQPTTDHRAVTMQLLVPLIPVPKPDEEEAASRDPRVKPPFVIDINWRNRRDRARTMELVVGFAAYFAATREGNVIAIATVVGIVGGVYAIRALMI